MDKFISVKGDESYIREIKRQDVSRIIAKFRTTFDEVKEADTADAYVIYKGERHRLNPVNNYGALRHALTNWDDVLSLLDADAIKFKWTEHYKINVYRRVKDLVDQEVIKLITGWYSKVCLMELAQDKKVYANQRKAYDTILSKSAAVGKELKQAKRDRTMLMHHILIGDYDKATKVARAIERRMSL